MTGLVVKLSATPGAVHSVGPDIGAQTEEILSSDLGLDAERIRI
jgi:crotonobetainyl-CoA:carnitine CoA-transferase CaiB-like acyl-CoA transferase